MSSPQVQGLKIESPDLSPSRGDELANVLMPEPRGERIEGIYISDNTRIDKSKLVIPEYYKPLIEYVMIPRGVINDRIEKLAMDIYDKFEHDARPPVLVCLLKGAYPFFERLTKCLRSLSQHRGSLKRPVYIEQFIKASSYHGMTRAQVVKIAQEGLDIALRGVQGQKVVLIEDILDSGNTLREVHDVCMVAGASAVQAAVLFVKRTQCGSPAFEADWAGFNVPNEFVLGYGTDLNEHFRDLEHLCAISKLGKAKFMQGEEGQRM